MKKNLVGSMAFVLAMTTALSGCGAAATVEEPASAASEEVQEAPAADTGAEKEADKEASEGTGTYDPASFDAADVYAAPDQKASIDITGCDTFTQIVDKLEDGKGYANATVGDEDVLLVSSGTYEWEPGKSAAIDAEIFVYKDGAPQYLATVSAGGTAYPLSVSNGNLYVGGNHFMSTYLVDNGVLVETEEAYVKYDTDGNDTYYYKTCNSQFEDYDAETAKSRFEEFFTAFDSAEVVEFQTVGGGNGASSSDAALPAYEYPGA